MHRGKEGKKLDVRGKGKRENRESKTEGKKLYIREGKRVKRRDMKKKREKEGDEEEEGGGKKN